jgi:hypothetical protein
MEDGRWLCVASTAGGLRRSCAGRRGRRCWTRRIGGRQDQAELCWPAWLMLLDGITLALCRIGGWQAQAELR